LPTKANYRKTQRNHFRFLTKRRPDTLGAMPEFCQRQGWEYVEYTDRMSGTKPDRTAFLKMFEDARLKKFDLVLFWALDRLSREGVTETLNYLKVLDSYGVAWKSFTESYLDSTGMFKEAVIAILAAVAKQEHARLSERVVAGLKRAKRQGKTLGRPKVIVDREKIREARAAGLSLRQIGAQFGISRTLVMNLLSAQPELAPNPTQAPTMCSCRVSARNSN
jgi:DNA invertase Pin-like site-specific DNA recombinase